MFWSYGCLVATPFESGLFKCRMEMFPFRKIIWKTWLTERIPNLTWKPTVWMRQKEWLWRNMSWCLHSCRYCRYANRLVCGLVIEGNVANTYFVAILFRLVMSGFVLFIANKSATILQSIFVMFAFIVMFLLMGRTFYTHSVNAAMGTMFYFYRNNVFGLFERCRWPLGAVFIIGFALIFSLVAAVIYKNEIKVCLFGIFPLWLAI